jgi:hypothetical protein
MNAHTSPRRLFASGVLVFAAILALGIVLSQRSPASTNAPSAPNGTGQTAPVYGY